MASWMPLDDPCLNLLLPSKNAMLIFRVSQNLYRDVCVMIFLVGWPVSIICSLKHISRSDVSDSSTIPAVDDLIENNLPSIGFHFCDASHSTIKHAVFTFAAPCKLWAGKNNWYSVDHVIQIRFAEVHFKTPILARLRHYEGKAKKILTGRHYYMPEYLDKILYMPILEGELLNESVSKDREITFSPTHPTVTWSQCVLLIFCHV